MIRRTKKSLERRSLSSERGASYIEFALTAAILLGAMIGVNGMLGRGAVAMQGKAVAAQKDAVACSAETKAVLGPVAVEACK